MTGSQRLEEVIKKVSFGKVSKRVYARILMSKINKDLDRLNILGI